MSKYDTGEEVKKIENQKTAVSKTFEKAIENVSNDKNESPKKVLNMNEYNSMVEELESKIK